MSNKRELQLSDLENFVNIYDADGEEENPIPENVKVTVYCDGGSADSEGYAEDIFSHELGLAALVARKWQYQTIVDEMLSTNPTP